MNFEDLKNKLIDKPQPIYVIQATQSYFFNELRETIKKSMLIEEQAMNFAMYDLIETPLAIALDDATSVPFFGDKRVVILDNPFFLTNDNKRQKITHDIESFEKYIIDPQTTTLLIVFVPYEKIDKRKKIVKLLQNKTQFIDLVNISGQTITQIVRDSLTNFKLSIDNNALDLLIQRTNGDLSNMMQEVSKLRVYCYGKTKITRHDVDKVVTKSLSENVFDLVNAVLANKITDAISLYRELRANGEEPLKMNALLLSQFRLILQVKGLITKVRSEKELATKLKVHPYRVKLANKIAQKFKFKDLIAVYLGVLNIELQLKSTQRNPDLLFELFMVEYQKK
ncbi:DNA polymerase III subunit delta [Periweissella beninensis]|uniref:DNA polymerase III subunit delta n=1 Tax=Periweissella beninensis TaxID=504936 RepID=UPI0021A93FA7|nr:DNA polymerase III subunit delta [Periweissella beninensis]MCT4396786.1 DNA polymerase III subunit delta [Periweissella beninensis]